MSVNHLSCARNLIHPCPRSRRLGNFEKHQIEIHMARNSSRGEAQSTTSCVRSLSSQNQRPWYCPGGLENHQTRTYLVVPGSTSFSHVLHRQPRTWNSATSVHAVGRARTSSIAMGFFGANLSYLHGFGQHISTPCDPREGRYKS